MEKGKALVSTTIALAKLDLNPKSNPMVQNPQSQSSRTQFGRSKSPPTLLNLCLGVVGSHLEDIVPHLADIALDFPPEIKRVLVAIARRRKLLKDDVIIALADESWDVLDLSASDVSDLGLAKVAEICGSLRAVDISRCDNITAVGVSELVHRCLSLETLRCGGSRNSDRTARRCLDVLKPKLNNVEGDSWEELKTEELVTVADTLRWLVWPQIDKDSLERYSTECPRIIVNPKPSPFGFRGTQVPWEALPDIQLDNSVVKDIDPKTWVTWGFLPRAMPPPLSISGHKELSLAEKFRLAFQERDSRLALKRAKNARQHQRRAARERMMMDTGRKALALASQASRSFHS
ncbi:putative leucine-rich repeat domain, L domain-containing protein [Rosa chinensis]|uniref:Putative leucine-rich repeat domain, L domain-containing protein n=1 Tax=Rosa chinensis TaxID=74649 RepID=A0A2P6QCE9_ROSCH|nr:uncharacterized protein LOC112164695 [Rosa chinensis]PRQ31858.1 putative leucine-rich repeat domain, L domain-containing protein [Rosa chinensis]